MVGGSTSHHRDQAPRTLRFDPREQLVDHQRAIHAFTKDELAGQHITRGGLQVGNVCVAPTCLACELLCVLGDPHLVDRERAGKHVIGKRRAVGRRDQPAQVVREFAIEVDRFQADAICRRCCKRAREPAILGFQFADALFEALDTLAFAFECGDQLPAGDLVVAIHHRHRSVSVPDARIHRGCDRAIVTRIRRPHATVPIVVGRFATRRGSPVASAARMQTMTNQVVQLRAFGDPDRLEVVEAPLPTPGRGEVRVRMLASAVEYTDVVIRRHLYLQTITRRPPFVVGYDMVGEIDQLGEQVSEFQVGDRVADMTVLGADARYLTLRADNLTRVPKQVDPAEAAALILSWTTAYQLLHRAAHVATGQRVLVQGAAGGVGQALITLGKLAGLDVWGTARGEHARLLRELGANPIDYEKEDFTRVLPNGFDVVFDGIGQDGYRRSLAAVTPGGMLWMYGYTASVQRQRRMPSIFGAIARTYLAGYWSGRKRARLYSINVMRALHPTWFKEDLGRLFDLLAAGKIRPRIAERISFAQIREAHRRIEAGRLDGKIVLCSEPSQRESPLVS